MYIYIIYIHKTWSGMSMSENDSQLYSGMDKFQKQFP